MTVKSSIESKLAESLHALHLEVVNESGNHNVPKDSETHFKVVVVSADFEGKNLVARHRIVHKLLDEEMTGGVHALALHTYTPEDWASRTGNAPMSPPCLGGKANESANANRRS